MLSESPLALCSTFSLIGAGAFMVLAVLPNGPLQMLGFSLLGGSALVVLMLEKAGALDDPSVKRLLTVAAVLGAVLGVGGFSVQVLAV